MSRRREAKRQPQKCPPHVRWVAEEYWLAREAYDAALEAACRGHLGSDEETDFRASNPVPTFKAILSDYYAAWRHEQALAHAA